MESGFAGELSGENKSRVEQMMAMLEAKEKQLLAEEASERQASPKPGTSAVPPVQASVGSKEASILAQIDQTLADPQTSEATKAKLSAMKATVLKRIEEERSAPVATVELPVELMLRSCLFTVCLHRTLKKLS